MNRTVSTIAAVAAMGILGPGLTACDEGTPLFPVTGTGAEELSFVDGESLDAKVLAYLDAKGAPGATVAITKDSRLVWAKGYGLADTTTDRLMQPETRSRIGSVSKFFTAVAAMQLVEDGRIDLDQHVYAPSAQPLWGDDRSVAPGVIFSGGGVLDDPGAYFDAMIEGVDNLGDTFPPADHLDEMPSWNWAMLNQAAWEAQITTILDRAEDVHVRDLLSHTAGYPKSGKGAKEAAAEVFGVAVEDVSETQQHQAFLMGLANAGAPFLHHPGTKEKYSNQGFTMAGHIVGKASDEGGYRAYVENHVLAPLGLDDVVPVNADISELDAQPHGSNNLPYNPTTLDGLNPSNVSRLGLATGGWSATARDLTRVMCSIDQGSNQLRSLAQTTVDLMAADSAPGAEGVNPLGWDSASGTVLTKDGDVTGGSARISKFLPGAFAADDDEINVAVAFNKGDITPSTTFLADLAEMAAGANIPDDYDLFDPQHACFVEPTFDVTTPLPTPHPDPNPDLAQPEPGQEEPTRPTPDPVEPPAPADEGAPTPEPEVDEPADPVRPEDPESTPAGPAIHDLAGYLSCDPPRRTLVGAVVEAPAGVASAQLHWRSGSLTGTQPLVHDEQNKLWVAVVMPPATELVLSVTDAFGRTTTATATVTPECVPPLGDLGLTAGPQDGTPAQDDTSELQLQIQVATSDLQ